MLAVIAFFVYPAQVIHMADRFLKGHIAVAILAQALDILIRGGCPDAAIPVFSLRAEGRVVVAGGRQAVRTEHPFRIQRIIFHQALGALRCCNMCGKRPQARRCCNIGLRHAVGGKVEIEPQLVRPELFIDQPGKALKLLPEMLCLLGLADFLGNQGEVICKLRLLNAQVVIGLLALAGGSRHPRPILVGGVVKPVGVAAGLSIEAAGHLLFPVNKFIMGNQTLKNGLRLLPRPLDNGGKTGLIPMDLILLPLCPSP